MTTAVIPLPVKSVAQAALAASLQASTTPAKVYGISGYNSKASAQFIQLHDASAPADAAVPVFNMTVGASSNFSIDFGFHGMDFQTAVFICNSSTAPTKTVGSGDCQFFLRLVPIQI